MVQCLAGPFFQAWLGQARDSDAGIFVYLFSFCVGGNHCITAITVVVRPRYLRLYCLYCSPHRPMDSNGVFLHGQLRVLVVKQDWLSRQTEGKKRLYGSCWGKPWKNQCGEKRCKTQKKAGANSQKYLMICRRSDWFWLCVHSESTFCSLVASEGSPQKQLSQVQTRRKGSDNFSNYPLKLAARPWKSKVGRCNFREGTSWSIDIRDVKGSTGDELKTSETSEWLQSIDPTQPIMQQFTVVYKHCRRRPNCLYLFKLLCKRLCMVPSI